MKIAVATETGVQTTRSGILEHYQLVASDYDFESIGDTDVTGTGALILFLQVGRHDYKSFRDSLKDWVTEQGFANLSAQDKYIAARFFACSYADQMTVLDFPSYVAFSADHHGASVDCRVKRLIKAQTHVYTRLSVSDAKTLAITVVGNGLIMLYYMYGVEGTLEGDPEGLFDWIEAREGTTFEATGLAVQQFTPTNGTLPELVALVIATLKGQI